MEKYKSLLLLMEGSEYCKGVAKRRGAHAQLEEGSCGFAVGPQRSTEASRSEADQRVEPCPNSATLPMDSRLTEAKLNRVLIPALTRAAV